MSHKLKAIIIDDEPIAINGLKKYLLKVDFIELIATCENAMDAREVISKHQIDLMFLDINMPRVSGIDFLRSLSTKPITIVTSAYPEFALQGYELDVIDYLVKPIIFERFKKACTKAKDLFDLQTKEQDREPDFFFVKSDKKLEKIFYDEVVYVEAQKNYISIVTAAKRFTIHLTLKNIEEQLPIDKFIKVQKSFIVAINRITGLSADGLLIGEKNIPISRVNKEQVMKKIFEKNTIIKHS